MSHPAEEVEISDLDNEVLKELSEENEENYPLSGRHNNPDELNVEFETHRALQTLFIISTVVFSVTDDFVFLDARNDACTIISGDLNFSNVWSRCGGGRRS